MHAAFSFYSLRACSAWFSGLIERFDARFLISGGCLSGFGVLNRNDLAAFLAAEHDPKRGDQDGAIRAQAAIINVPQVEVDFFVKRQQRVSVDL